MQRANRDAISPYRTRLHRGLLLTSLLSCGRLRRGLLLILSLLSCGRLHRGLLLTSPLFRGHPRLGGRLRLGLGLASDEPPLLNLAERHGEPRDQPGKAVHQPGEGAGGNANELAVQDVEPG